MLLNEIKSSGAIPAAQSPLVNDIIMTLQRFIDESMSAPNVTTTLSSHRVIPPSLSLSLSLI